MSATHQTKIPFIPSPYKVVLKATFKISTLNLHNPEVIKDLIPDTLMVIAKGAGTDHLSVCDEVLIEDNRQLAMIDFKWNNQSLKAKQKIHAEGKTILGLGSVNIEEYFITSVNNIAGVHTNGSDAN